MVQRRLGHDDEVLYQSDFGYNGFTDGKTELDPEDDAAYVNWGTSWRMPTMEQQQELSENCSWTCTTMNGVNGQLGTSKRNGNTIFLPAAGYRQDSSLNSAALYGLYWSRTLNPSGSASSSALNFASGNVGWYGYYFRSSGYTVRAVRVSEE